MEPVSSAVAQTVTNSVVELVKKNVDYIRYRQNVYELDECVKQLEHEKARVDHQCEEAVQKGHIIELKAKEWLRKVGEFETEVDNYKKDDDHKKTQLSNCSFPYFRHRLGRLAKKKAVEGKKLIDDCPKSNEIAYRENVTSNDAVLSNTDLMEFGSRKSIMEDIMAKLEDPTVRMIGLHGPGGVGKSTLVKAIADKAKKLKLFNVVAISEITVSPNLRKIQEDIAYVLGLKLEGEGENVRADCLRRRLKQEKENTLIILDDLWNKLDLNKLGIPLGDDVDDKGVKKEKSLGDYKGCKILLTSRDVTVLSEKMLVKSIFGVKELDDTEALTLLKKVAGIHDQMSHSKQEIVKKYSAGIPMAIVTVGNALRDKSELVWEATLEKLKNQELVGGQNPMEISVKMSYDNLENEELKSIFLLCAQMGHQPLIMDLVKYCFGLGILEGVHSLREARERINTLITKLKNSSLLLNESPDNHFNMHDMIREAALSIARKKQNVFTLRNDKLVDWPELKRCTSISICNSDIFDALPYVMNCPQLKFFQIDSNNPSLKIPENFFRRMKKLRVLILTGIHLPSLPSSIKYLSNLRLLCLERCILDGNLSFMGELKKLKILSFSGSKIKNFPVEGCFDKLQLLDISNCSIENMIPPIFLSRLTSLEELYIGKSLIKKDNQFSFLSELKHLHQLKVVDLCITCLAILPKDLFFDMLDDYKIVIGDLKTLSMGDFRMPDKFEELRSLALQLKKDDKEIHSQKGIKLLLKRVENLLLGGLKGVENVINELNLDGFPDLKHLSITNSNDIKYVNSMNLSHRAVFPKLESLCLCEMKNIETICCSPVTVTSFGKLKTIKIKMCTRLKNLFSFYIVKFLASLESIDVSECKSLKEIVEITENCDKVEFLKLHSLTLQSLPSFTSFYTTVKGRSVPELIEAQSINMDHSGTTVTGEERGDMAPLPLFAELVEFPKLESLNLLSVSIYKIWSDTSMTSFCFQNLIKLVVKDCRNLKTLCSLTMASGLKKLKGLVVSGCPMMEKIFSIGGNSAEKVCVFPNLEELHLSKMKLLTDIWQVEVSVHSFSSLISLHVEKCKKLDKIFPSHMEEWFTSLNSLKVVHCKSVRVIFEIDSMQMDAFGGIDTNLQHILVHDLPKLKQVWSRDPSGFLNFKKLQSIQVSSCDKLRNVFPASVAKDVPMLQYLSVARCERMLKIVEDGSETNNEPLVFPELTYMELDNLSNIKLFYKGRHSIECPKLKWLTVKGCEKLNAFRSNKEEKTVFSAEKVFPNLEYLQIHLDEAHKWLWINSEKYQMHCLKELSLDSVKSVDLFYSSLYRMSNLEKLSIFFGEYQFEELVPSASIAPQERLGAVLQLKELVLSYSKMKDLGFEREPVLQRLERLSLNWCDYLNILAPPLVSLTYLTDLEVSFCSELRNLMTSSTAKSLVQLKSMKVIQCDKVEQIVTNVGNEENDIEIVFRKLITIELVELNSLTSFCSHEKCKFQFPSLEMLTVRECLMMETFTQGHTEAPKLQNILAVEAEWQGGGEDGLNATPRNNFKEEPSPKIKKALLELQHIFTVEGKRRGQWKDVRNTILPKYFKDETLLELQNIFDVEAKHQGEGKDVWTAVLRKYVKDELPGTVAQPFPTTKRHPRALESRDREEEVKWQWETDLNATITKIYRDKVCFGYTKYMNLSRYPDLIKKLWHGNHLELQNNFCNLKCLSVYKCKGLGHVIPSHLLPHFENLEELIVEDCNEVQVIFNTTNEMRAGVTLKASGMNRLKKLSLKNLPKLGHVWDKDSAEGIIGLQGLQYMRIDNCECLKSLFPASAVKDITKSLQVLQVTKCRELVVIFSKDAEGAKQEFVFHHLTSLTLRELPGLKYLYPGLHTVEWPVLKKLDAYNCEMLKLKCQEEDHPEEQQVPTQIEKIIQIPSLKKLFFGIGDTLVSWDGGSGKLKFHNQYKYRFPKELGSALLNRFLHMLPTIQKVAFEEGRFEEMFSAKRPNSDYITFLLHLSKGLELRNMYRLKSIGLERSWLQPFPENLQTLQVKSCNSLKNYLLSGTVSFSNLTYLEVISCKELLYLFTSSTAKSLGQLKKMKIKECGSLKEIVSIGGDETHEDSQIIFAQLRFLYLEELHQLRCFYPGNIALCFPTLEQVYVIDCNLMKTFSPVNKIDHSTQWFSAKYAIPQREYCHLNSAVARKFEEKYLESARVSDLSLIDSPLQEIWHGSRQIPHLCFRDLHSLIVDGCQFLSDAVLPFNLLHFFTKLATLEVRNCDFLKTIFDVKCITQDRIMTFPLKKLTLSKLSNLKNVWNEDPHGILRMKLLQKVSVENCKYLTSVFPASVAKDLVKLEKLAVKYCKELMEIVAYDNADPRGTNLECPSVRSLELKGLPKLKYFYVCSLGCDLLKTDLEPHPKDHVCIEKCLTLGENGVEMILRGEFPRELLHNLKVLTLFFHTKSSDVSPYEILKQVPNIEKLVVFDGPFKEIFCQQSLNVGDTGLVSHLKLLRLESLQNMVSVATESSWIEPLLINLETLQVISCSRLKNLVPCTVSFSRLTCLEVDSCDGLLYLFTSSATKSLTQLKTMKITWCYSIKEILSKEEDESVEDDIIFSQLNCLELGQLPKLKRFYKGSLNFPSLDQLSVYDCDSMETLCPGTIKADKLWEMKLERRGDVIPLENDLNSTMRKTFLKKFSESAYLILKDSSVLQEIWHGSPLQVSDSCFSNLSSLTVDECQFLSDAVLPFHLLPFFTKLKSLIVRKCYNVKTIFGVKRITQDIERTTMGPFPLPFALEKLTFDRLPNLENVWNEDPREISTQQLRYVSVEKCKCLTSVFPASVAKDLVKLEYLVVKKCGELMEIVATGTNLEPTFPAVTSLTLWNLPKLKYNRICCIHDAITTFQLTPKLQHLTLGENEVKMILDGEFKGNHLQKLEVLTLHFDIEFDVFPCEFLQQVTNVEKLVVCSGSFKEIFCLQSAIMDDTVFLSQLKVLRLESLGELVSIGLENSWIEPFLRNLETLQVIGCSCLKIFVPRTLSFSSLTCLEVDNCDGLLYLFTSSTAKSLDQLKTMKIKGCRSTEEIVSKEEDESVEDEMVFPQLNCLELGRLPKLKRFYEGSLSFPSLEDLSVIDCKWMETLCPGTLKADKLREVKLKWYSDAIPLEILDLKSTMLKEFRARILESEDLTLRGDSQVLQEIWHGSQPILDSCFNKLGSLTVDRCQFLLDAVLPFKLLSFFTKLETLKVRNCDNVKTIFDVKCTPTQDRIMTLPLKELILERLPNLENVWNADKKGTNLDELTFPDVKSLALRDLPKLKYFWQCDMLNTTFTHLEPQLCIEKLTPNLECLTLGENELKMVLHGEFQGNHLKHKLKVLTLYIEFNVFQGRVPNIEKLVVFDGSFKETFPFDSLNVDEAGLLSHLKVLCSDSLPELVSIGLDDNSRIVPFLKNLETLEVMSCLSSINLEPYITSFSKLTYLKVERCNSLLYLFTSSTAKSLAQLKTMKIKWCDSIKEIVSKEGDESPEPEPEMIFPQLNCLKLKYLPKLRRFYRGSLSFPSLDQLSVFDCYSMEILCAGTVKTDKLLEVKFERRGDAIPLKTDLNSAMQNR